MKFCFCLLTDSREAIPSSCVIYNNIVFTFCKYIEFYFLLSYSFDSYYLNHLKLKQQSPRYCQQSPNIKNPPGNSIVMIFPGGFFLHIGFFFIQILQFMIYHLSHRYPFPISYLVSSRYRSLYCFAEFSQETSLSISRCTISSQCQRSVKNTVFALLMASSSKPAS